MLDYLVLKIIWWLLVGVLLTGFAIMDGHDMGMGTLLPFIARTDTERRVTINTVAPHWEGNQVWFITAGGAIFAAWPFVYATAFSGMYWALLLVLFAMFFRPVGFTYRSKLTDPKWRAMWDWGIFAGSAIPALVFGVAFGNLFRGVPFTLDDTMRSFYSGNLFGLLNPMALLFGVVSLSMLVMQGATYVAHRTDGTVQARSKKAAVMAGIVLLVAFSLAGVWVSQINGYSITAMPDPGSAMNPLMKQVALLVPGGWFANFGKVPALWAFPLLGYVGTLLAIVMARSGRTLLAFIGSSVACLAIIFTAGVALFPFILPSSEMPQASLTMWDAVSSHKTLNVMFWVAIIFTPLVLAYTSWAYYIMRGTITPEYLKANDKSLY